MFLSNSKTVDAPGRFYENAGRKIILGAKFSDLTLRS